MNELWLAMRFLLDHAHSRAKAALRGDLEAGALTIEWIVIAVSVAAAAAIAYGLFKASINREAAKLP